MRWQRVQRHFPFLLGRLPRLLLATPGSLVALGKRYLVELTLAIPLVVLFLATIAGEWGYLQVCAAVTAAIVLPLLYLVLLMMVRQHRRRS